MPGSIKGMLIGLANALVVAFCIALSIARADLLEATTVIMMFAAVPSALTGTLLGCAGEKMQYTNRRVLLVTMIAISCAVVACLGTILDLQGLIFVSCIPTVAACSILERWTRAKPDEVFPAARVA